MALVPALDLRPQPDAETRLPSNVEAEQALIGAVLYDNAALDRLPIGFKGEHFHEPLHTRLFDVISREVSAGRLADVFLVADKFQADPAFIELGDVRYLADLIDRAPPAANARDYAAAITDLWFRREAIRNAQRTIHLAQRGQDDDGKEVTGRMVIDDAEAGLYRLGEVKGGQGFVDFGTSLVKAVAMVAAAAGREGGISGLSTGLHDVDQLLGGLHPSDLIILAARPSMGKTALATNISFNVANHYRYSTTPEMVRVTEAGGVVGFFSLEMSDEQLAMRILADVSGVSGDDMRKGHVDSLAYGRIVDASQMIQAAPLYTDATGAIAISKLAARARRLKRTHGLDLIVVDYLQLVNGEAGHGQNRTNEIGNITGGLKALAKDLNVPVLALAQLSRQVEARENKRPQLSDLRESGSIEQDADVVAFLYREEYYLLRDEPAENTDEHFAWQGQMDAVRNKAELIIAKQRHGPIGTVHLGFNGKTTKFTSLAHSTDKNQARLPMRDD